MNDHIDQDFGLECNCCGKDIGSDEYHSCNAMYQVFEDGAFTVSDAESIVVWCQECEHGLQIMDRIRDYLKPETSARLDSIAEHMERDVDWEYGCYKCGRPIELSEPMFAIDTTKETSHGITVSVSEAQMEYVACLDCAKKHNLKEVMAKEIRELVAPGRWA